MFPGVLPLPKGCTTGKPPKGANSSCCASNGWDRQALGREQLADKDVGALTRRTEAGQNPEWGIYDEGRIYKNYFAQAKSLTTRDSILENHLDSADGIKDGLDSHPPTKTYEVQVEVYRGTSRGHLGTNKTTDNVRQRYYWFTSVTTSRADVNSVKTGPQTEVPEPEVGA